MGLDADIITKTGLIANGATSATIALTTGGETYYPAVVTTAIDLYAPVVSVNKSVVDLNGGSVRPEDILEYTNTVQVTGGEAATGFVLSELMPANASYVPGSMSITTGGTTVPVTDAAGDDPGNFEMATGRAVFRLGTGATASAGGTLAVGASATVRFRVKVNATALDGSVIPAQASAAFAGQSTGANLSASSNVASLTVTRPRSVSAFGGLPDGFAFAGATPELGSFDAATGVWTIGDMASGASATLRVSARVLRAGAASGTARILSGDLGDPTPDAATSVAVTPQGVDLAVRVEGMPESAAVGRTLDLRVIASNRGPDAATRVAIPVAIPAGFRLVAASAGQGSFDPATGLWTAGTVAAGGGATLTLTLEVVAAGTMQVTAGPVASDQFDASAADDTARLGMTTRAAPVRAAEGTSSLWGVIFADGNGDGVQGPGEAGVANATVVLEGTDADGNPVRLVAITAADGSYRFSNLRAGTYTLTMTSAAGSGAAGSLGGRASGGQVLNIVVGDGEDGVGYSFAAAADAPVVAVGPEAAPAGRIAGHVYLDRNRNGVFNPGRDPGIATIRVILTGVDDRGVAVRLETTTDAAGAYAFDGLRPGVYAIHDVPTRFFRGRRRASGVPSTGIVVAAATSAVFDFAKLPAPGCRLVPILAETGRALPRGPLIDRFFPGQPAARSLRGISARPASKTGPDRR